MEGCEILLDGSSGKRGKSSEESPGWGRIRKLKHISKMEVEFVEEATWQRGPQSLFQIPD